MREYKINITWADADRSVIDTTERFACLEWAELFVMRKVRRHFPKGRISLWHIHGTEYVFLVSGRLAGKASLVEVKTVKRKGGLG